MSCISRTAMVAGVFLVGLIAAPDARAQVTVTPGPVAPVVGPVVSPWFFGGGSYGGGTVAGNFLFGLGQVIRAEGDYNLETAQGMNNFEAARSQYIDNMAKAWKVAARMTEDNSAWRAQELARNRHSPEALAQAAASDLPRELTINELDPATGMIVWPEALMGDQVAALRYDMEHQFELRAWTGQSPGTAAKIRDDARQMRMILRGSIGSMLANDFVAARKFIDSLELAAVASRKPVHTPDHLARRGR